MTQMDRREVLKGAVGLGVAGVLLGRSAALAGGTNARYRWDIVNVLGGCTEEGGEASSKSLDGARITVTGSGTFRDGPGHSQNVTGGGTYLITAGTSTPASSGTYKVVRFVGFVLAPGTPPPIADCIGIAADRRAGRLTVAILFDDGSEGVLEVGCRLVGSPGSIMEGITATKGFVTFWNHEEPVAGAEGNRTLFHLLP
ncbi:MAG: hypothetical protein ACRDGE_08905 [Candidatus Limnocylindria bacterium]